KNSSLALKARIPLTLSLALLCAIEQAGRDVLRFKTPDRDSYKNRKCFDEFLHNYMAYQKISSNRYDIFRNGVVHSGLPKSENRSGVGLEPHVIFLNSRKLKIERCPGNSHPSKSGLRCHSVSTA